MGTHRTLRHGTDHGTDTETARVLHQVVAALPRTIEIRDPYTHGHQQRVSALSRLLAQELGLPAEQVDAVRLAATLHDIGKIGVPSDILVKPTRLSAPEIALVREHSALGADILSSISFAFPIADIVRQHHERLDGSGYPDGLRGDDILLEARIIAVADTVEAIASHRPYRPGFGIATAMDELVARRGSQYDADVVDACSALYRGGRIDSVIGV